LIDIFTVSHLFSWQHFLIIAFVVAYTIGLHLITRKRSKNTQHKILFTLSMISVLLFAWRWRVLFTGQELTPGEYGGLLPLELCNIGAFVLPFAVFFKKRFLFVFSFYVNLLGAAFALALIPEALHARFFLHPQFLDFFIIHAGLVAIPFTMIACGWYKPRLKDAVFATTLFLMLCVLLLGVNLFLDAINWVGDHTNYMFIMGSKGFPILDQLNELIPIPLIYLLPILPLFFVYCILVTLPHVKRGEWRKQFIELGKSFKTAGFK